MNGEGAALDGRLVWRCRRGMKELDLVLMRYLRERWPAAGDDERAQFERVLELPDPQLAAYLMGRETAPDPRMQALLDHIGRGLPAAR
jgi:antitoxin CptB